jgi:hypothetical protein
LRATGVAEPATTAGSSANTTATPTATATATAVTTTTTAVTTTTTAVTAVLAGWAWLGTDALHRRAPLELWGASRGGVEA